jgi:hypothetical protein
MRTLRRFLSLLLVSLALLTATAYGAPGDQDNDGIADSADNCPAAANPDQADRNANGAGDACDDPDKDGLSDQYELYTTYGGGAMRRTNPDKKDTDGDGLSDGYEVNRSYGGGRKTDPTLRDTDADGWEDSTEVYAGTDPTNADSDGDGVRDSMDNCALVHNPDQKNTYGGPRGDACENPPPPPPCSGVNPCQLDPAAKAAEDAAAAAQEAIRQLPLPDVRAVGDLAKMASDGHVVTVWQNAPDYLVLQVMNATTGLPVALNLPDTGYYSVNGDVGVFAVTADDTPQQNTRVSVKWRYSSRTKKLIIRVEKKQNYTAPVLFMVPPVGYSASCTPAEPVTGPCGTHAMGYYNPAKTLRAVDALDAVPYPITLTK